MDATSLTPSESTARRRFLLAALLVVLLVPALSPSSSAASRDPVKFRLKVDEADPAVVDVSVSFNLAQGEKVALAPPLYDPEDPFGLTAPLVELVADSNPQYVIEPSAESAPGWMVTGLQKGPVTVDYRVVFEEINSARSFSEAPGGVLPPAAISEPDLKVFTGSDVLMCPRSDVDGSPAGKDFEVELDLAPGEKSLSPWEPLDDTGRSYAVKSEAELLENYICWGDLSLGEFAAGETEVKTGFSSDYRDQSPDERALYQETLSTVLADLQNTFGDRARSGKLAVLFCGARRFGFSQPASGTLLESVVVFHGGGTLSDEAAVAATRGFFELWNRYQAFPAPGGSSRWFQEGMSLFYPLRAAALSGLIDPDEAYEKFSLIYQAYLSDPVAQSVTLEDAETRPGAGGLLATKGASVVASLASRLSEETDGGEDLEWLLNSLMDKHGPDDSEGYSLVDISELVEVATSTSWDRYFEERIRGTEPVLASEFSRTDLVGNSGSYGRRLVVDGGSGNNWIYLIGAIVLILLIPVVMGPYVRRAVRLDMTMPRIFSDDDDED